MTLRSKVTNNGTRHIVWRWSTYMPNMKSLPWTTRSYSPDTICYGCRDQFDLEVKGHQQWYATHAMEVVYLHAKYEKRVLNDKKVIAPTRFVMDARTSLTLRSKVTNNCTGHIVCRWSTYMPNMQSLSWKVTARTQFVTDARTDGQTDHYRASAT